MTFWPWLTDRRQRKTAIKLYRQWPVDSIVKFTNLEDGLTYIGKLVQRSYDDHEEILQCRVVVYLVKDLECWQGVRWKELH